VRLVKPHPFIWAYFALTEIILGLTSSDFGSVMVKMPFSNSAFALSEITPTGSAIERSNEPNDVFGQGKNI